MLIGTRTSAPEAQEAVVQRRLDYQAAQDAMVAAINGKPWVAPNGLVGPQNGCPECGNRLMDDLRLHEGDYEGWVTCDRCGHNYYIG